MECPVCGNGLTEMTVGGIPVEACAGVIGSSVRNRTVAGLFAGFLVTFVLLFGPLIVYPPILMNERFGSSPLVIGVVVASTSLTTALTSTPIGRLTYRLSEKTLVRASARP